MAEEVVRLNDLPVIGSSSQLNDIDGERVIRRERRPFRERANRALVNAVLVNEEQEKFYFENYTCVPDCKNQVGGPPLFILTITIIQVGFFIYHSVSSPVVTWWGLSQTALHSPLMFSPYHREQVWRFLTYMLVHAGISHILSNVIVQLLLGIPLELVHGSLRIMGIYIIGVIAGSLGSSVFNVGIYLVGASGGDFALMFAFLANVIMNWDSMKLFYAIMRVSLVSVFIIADFASALYRYYGDTGSADRVSYAAHLAGALAGLLCGFFLLKNFKTQKWEDILMKASIAIFIVCILASIFFNIFCPCYEPYKSRD